MNKRLLSMLPALCMVVTVLPVTVMAEETHTTIGGSGEIISFAPLTGTAKSVSLGTSMEDLELPETLTARGGNMSGMTNFASFGFLPMDLL